MSEETKSYRSLTILYIHLFENIKQILKLIIMACLVFW